MIRTNGQGIPQPLSFTHTQTLIQSVSFARVYVYVRLRLHIVSRNGREERLAEEMAIEREIERRKQAMFSAPKFGRRRVVWN